jgi:hypothetical protein
VRLELPGRQGCRLREHGCLGRGAGQGGLGAGGADGRRVDAGERESHVDDGAGLRESDHGGDRDEREVPVSPRDLDERGAGARSRLVELHGDEQLVGLDGGAHDAPEEGVRRDPAFAAWSRDYESRIERDGNGWELRGGVCVRDAPADRAARPRRGMADPRQRLGEEGAGRRELGRSLRGPLPYACADPRRGPVDRDLAQLVEPADVEDVGGRGEAEVEDR